MSRFLYFFIISILLISNIFCTKKKKNDVEILDDFLKSEKYKPVTVLLSLKNPPLEPKETLESDIKESTLYVEYENIYKAVMSELCKSQPSLALNSPICDKSALNGKNEFNVNNPEIKFLDNTFMKWLLKFVDQILLNGIPQPISNLRSLIIKWLLIKRREYPGDESRFTGTFTEFFEDARQVNSHAHGSSRYIINPINLSDTNFYLNSSNNSLVALECIRNWKNGLESKFKNLLRDLYSEGKVFYIDILHKHFDKEKKFSDKSDESTIKILLNSDPLLAFLWYEKTERRFNFFETGIGKQDHYINAKDDKKNLFSKMRTFSFIIDPLFIDSKSDLNLVVDGNHGIAISFYKGDNFPRLGTALELFERHDSWNWESIVKTLKFPLVEQSNSEIIKNFELRDALDVIKFEIENSLYLKAFESSIEYENQIEKNRKSGKNPFKPKYISYKKLYKRVLRVLMKHPVNDEIIRKQKLEFHRKDFLKKLCNLIQSQPGISKTFPKTLPHNLLRLVFKWLIFQRQEFDRIIPEFKEEIKENWKCLMKYFPIPFSSNPERIEAFIKKYPETKEIQPWSSLVYLEAIGRKSEIIETLDSIAKAFFHGSEGIRGNCDEIINLYFGGRANNDIILKFMIFESDLKDISMLNENGRYDNEFNRIDRIFHGGEELCQCFASNERYRIHKSPNSKFAIIGAIELEKILGIDDCIYLDQKYLDGLGGYQRSKDDKNRLFKIRIYNRLQFRFLLMISFKEYPNLKKFESIKDFLEFKESDQEWIEKEFDDFIIRRGN